MTASYWKYLATLLLTTGLSIPAFSQPTTSSLLWKIEGKGLEQPSNIFGTVHMLKRADYRLSQEVLQLMAESEAVYMEVDLDNLEALSELAQLLTLPPGTTLLDYMTEEEYTIIKNYLEDSLNVNIREFEILKPFALQQAFTANTAGEDLVSYEMELMSWCYNNSKTIEGIETVAEQMAIFDQIPYEEQIDWVLDFIENPDVNEGLFDSIVYHYRESDLDGLYKDLLDSSPEIMVYEPLFISDRNKRWIPRMEAIMQKGTYFFAVGAGHLPGESGVLELLKASGYTVQPVIQTYIND
jgi:uncharacterized protein